MAIIDTARGTWPTWFKFTTTAGSGVELVAAATEKRHVVDYIVVSSAANFSFVLTYGGTPTTYLGPIHGLANTTVALELPYCDTPPAGDKLSINITSAGASSAQVWGHTEK